MKRVANWLYTDVPRMGTVHFSPMALTRLLEARVSEAELEAVLSRGRDRKAFGGGMVAGYRQFEGVCLEFRTWRHLPGAAVVCVNGYRVTT